MPTRIGLLLISLLLTAGINPARAQNGLMNSISFSDISPAATLQVQALDNSDANLALQTEIENSLRDQGYTVSADAVLVLTFETRDEIGSWSTTDRRHVLSFESHGGRSGGENVKAKVNVFDNQSGGLFNKGHSGTQIVTPSSYRIDASIEDKRNGKRLWQGWAVADLGAEGSLSLRRKMVVPLIDGIGKTVREQPFKIY